jgi:predicted Zn-dependent protease
MSFTGNIAPQEVIETLQEDLMARIGRHGIGSKGRPIVMGRSILEPIDNEARIRAKEGREKVKTVEQKPYAQQEGQTIQRRHKDEETVIATPTITTARDLCGNGGQVFTRHSPRIRWTKFPVVYYIDSVNAPVTDKSTVDYAINRAFNGFNVAYQLAKGRNDVTMFSKTVDRTQAKIIVQWQYLDGALRNLGRCYYSWYTTGQMKSAQVNFDVADKWYISTVERCGYSGLYFDIQNIAMHEIGHAIGLAHNTVDAYATMYPTSKAGETLRRSLGNADLAAFRDLYGPV